MLIEAGELRDLLGEQEGGFAQCSRIAYSSADAVIARYRVGLGAKPRLAAAGIVMRVISPSP